MDLKAPDRACEACVAGRTEAERPVTMVTMMKTFLEEPGREVTPR